MKHMITVLALIVLFGSLSWSAEEGTRESKPVPPIAYPPELILRESALVCTAPKSVGLTASMWASSGRGIRAYQLFNFSVDPADLARGSQWVAYDCGQKRITVLVEDMNAACGVDAKEGGSGQRVTATMQSGLLLGTGPAKGAATFSCGAVVSP